MCPSTRTSHSPSYIPCPDYQRSPAVAPGISHARPDTPAMTNIVCLLYSNRLKKKDLTKDGELCGQFQVVVAGECASSPVALTHSLKYGFELTVFRFL